MIHHTNILCSTCGAGCRCVRVFIVDSNEAGFRSSRIENCEELAEELLAKRVEHGFEPVRINRAGRCLVDWNVKLKEEKIWLYRYGLAAEDGKRVAREQREAEDEERREREERENAEVRRLVIEEAERWVRDVEVPKREERERERRKAQFMGSFKGLKWL